MKPLELNNLQPSDVLLYWTPCIADAIISFKTWSDVAHVEVYEGGGMSSAARADGVNLYAFRREGLRYVLRPRQAPENATGQEWFRSHAQGFHYDWIGLLGFDWPWHTLRGVTRYERRRMFCSMYATMRLRAAKVEVFDPAWPADKVPPMLFKTTPALRQVWAA